MTYPTQFSEWLKLASEDGRGGINAQPFSFVRGQSKTIRYNLGAHEVYGNWTGGAFTADLRASPDASGAALATFTVSVGTPAGGITPVTFALDGSAHGSIPADTDGDGVTEVLMQIDFTPTSGTPQAIIQTRALFVGNV